MIVSAILGAVLVVVLVVLLLVVLRTVMKALESIPLENKKTVIYDTLSSCTKNRKEWYKAMVDAGLVRN